MWLLLVLTGIGCERCGEDGPDARPVVRGNAEGGGALVVVAQGFCVTVLLVGWCHGFEGVVGEWFELGRGAKWCGGEAANAEF